VTAGRDRTVRIWDIGTPSQVGRFDLPTPASAIDVTSSGDIVAAVGWDIVHLERTTDRPL
jgi:hypothetical protein